jgi:ribosomal protein S1
MHGTRIGRLALGALFVTAALGLLAACDTMTTKSEPKPMTPIENIVEVSATVEKLDLQRRLLSLKSEQTGEQLTVQVDPAVQNLPQVKVGDRVVARYREAIGATISASAAGDPVTVGLAQKRADPGQKPAAETSSTTNIPVTITAVDTKSNLVTFAGQDGLVRAITVTTPEAKEFIKQLKPGDTVVISYTRGARDQRRAGEVARRAIRSALAAARQARPPRGPCLDSGYRWDRASLEQAHRRDGFRCP